MLFDWLLVAEDFRLIEPNRRGIPGSPELRRTYGFRERGDEPTVDCMFQLGTLFMFFTMDDKPQPDDSLSLFLSQVSWAGSVSAGEVVIVGACNGDPCGEGEGSGVGACVDTSEVRGGG